MGEGKVKYSWYLRCSQCQPEIVVGHFEAIPFERFKRVEGSRSSDPSNEIGNENFVNLAAFVSPFEVIRSYC